MSIIKSKTVHTSGIPLGGIGAGTVEIKPDGSLAEWQIMNAGRWINNDETYMQQNSMYELGVDTLSFFLRTAEGGSVKVRKLGLNIGEHEFRNVMCSWLKCIPEINFEGKFSYAKLDYIDETLPVSVSGLFLSPFICHDARSSATPGLYATFSITNTLSKTLDVSLLSKFKNPINITKTNKGLVNRLIKEKDVTGVFMSSSLDNEFCANGSMCLTMENEENTEITAIPAEFRGYIDTYILNCGYGVTQQSMLYDFARDGKLFSSQTTENPSQQLNIKDITEIESYTDAQLDMILTYFEPYPFYKAVLRRLEHIDSFVLSSRESKIIIAKHIFTCLNELDGEQRNKEEFGDAALCKSLKLQPGETKEIKLTLSWFFPNHYSENQELIGHMYQNWFKDAYDVNQYLNQNYNELVKDTLTFTNNLYNSTFASYYISAWADQLTTIKKCSYWTKENRFAIWEGLGCCGLHTTDITYHGSFPLISIFPELQKNQMLYGTNFIREDGRVHHSILRNMKEVDKNGFSRVDMNPQFVLLVCRDYLFTNDKVYLNQMWQHVKTVMENMRLLDIDNDGLPDTDTGDNTYDAWRLQGTPSYIGSLHIAAITASLHLAKAVNDNSWYEQWSKILTKAIPAFEAKLWNGNYYNLWSDKDLFDDGCMTSQIEGEWFLKSTGLPSQLNKEHINLALDSIFKNNYSIEGGLVNVSYPKDAKCPTLHAFENLQGSMNWTGIEYLSAAMMINFDKEYYASQITENVHNRYTHLGRQWNHQECGDHYYRAMSGWTILTALTNMTYDTTTASLSIKIDTNYPYEAPFVLPQAYGRIISTKEGVTLQILKGVLNITTINNTKLENTISLQTGDKILLRDGGK